MLIILFLIKNRITLFSDSASEYALTMVFLMKNNSIYMRMAVRSIKNIENSMEISDFIKMTIPIDNINANIFLFDSCIRRCS